MRYVAIDTPGGPEQMVIRDGDRPVPMGTDVLIEVTAAGVNRPDIMQRCGLYPPPKGANPVLGLEVAGRIAAIGPEVTRRQIGEKICALTNGGGYAEYALAPEGQCLPIPKGLSSIEAASLPETYFTVWANVFDRCGLAPGERFLVHGGTSGIGVSAIQMARAWGAEVYATAGTAEKCEACLALGAQAAVNYKTRDFVEELMHRTDSAGMDVILDMVAGAYVQKNLDLAAPGGRISIIAGQGGFQGEVNFLPFLLKRVTLTGSTLRPRNAAFKATIAAQLEAHIWPFIEDRQIKPVIHTTFPLDSVGEAHQLMEAGTHIGKIILTTGAPP